MNPQHVAGDGGGKFPSEKLCAQVIPILETQLNDRMLSLDQRFNCSIMCPVLIPLEFQIDKEAVVSLCLGLHNRFLCDGNQASPFFPGAFRKELFNPQTECRERWRGGRRRDERRRGRDRNRVGVARGGG